MNEKDIVEILKDYYEARHIRPGFPPVYEDEYHLDCAKAIINKLSEEENKPCKYTCAFCDLYNPDTEECLKY